MAKKRLLSIKDVAEILNVSEGTVRNLVKNKELAPPRKVNGRLARWFPSDVTAYLVRLRDQKPDENLDSREAQGSSRRRRERQSDSGTSAGS